MRRLLLIIFCWVPLLAGAQSRRVAGLWAELARHPAPNVAREQALWRLAWERELPPRQQDSLAGAATALARLAGDPAGQQLGQVFGARQLLAAGQRAAAQRQLLPLLAQARRQGNAWEEMLACIMLGRTHWGTATHPAALRYFQQAWAAAQRQPDVAWQARTALLQGNFHNNYARGLEWYFRGLRLAEQVDCQSCQADALGSIGYNYSLLEELALAERYARQSLAIHTTLGNQNGQFRSLTLLAELVAQRHHYAAAGQLYRQAAALAFSASDSLTLAAGLAGAYERLGHYTPARTQARRGLALAHRLGNLDLTAALEANLASLALRTGRPDSAVYFGRRAYAHRQKDGGRQVTQANCLVLAQAYAQRRDFARAYAFQARYVAYTDTLTSDKIRARAAQAQYSYQLEKKQRQIAQLARDRALGQLRQQRQLAAGGLLLLLVLGAGAAALSATRRRQHRRLAALREQIAADLHDEVGGLLTQLALEGAYLRETQPATPAQVQHLDRVAEVSQQAARQLRDVVWSIDTRHDSMTDLLDHLRDYLHELLGTADLEASFVADPALAALPLPLPVRDALYFVFKEALHNVVKHAHAHRVQVQLRLAGSAQLELSIEDDGHGLPPGLATTALTRGLRNMSRRAAAAAGHITFEPGESGGLRVRLRLPLR